MRPRERGTERINDTQTRNRRRADRSGTNQSRHDPEVTAVGDFFGRPPHSNSTNDPEILAWVTIPARLISLCLCR